MEYNPIHNATYIQLAISRPLEAAHPVAMYGFGRTMLMHFQSSSSKHFCMNKSLMDTKYNLS